jgi:hypothetical protein
LPKNEDGFTHVFVAVDVYFKYCFLYPLKSLTTVLSGGYQLWQEFSCAVDAWVSVLSGGYQL